MYKNYEDKLNTILSNAKGEKPTKINLSKIDDIEEFIDRAFGLEEFVEEAIDDAQVLVVRARDIVRFDMNDAIIQADQLLNEFEADVKELGIDLPARAKQLRKQIEDAEGLQKELERRIRDL
tara:strand:+ start:712 stop:1077 length:366 start_codon:yes stop_codon:yes gene_type:complete